MSSESRELLLVFTNSKDDKVAREVAGLRADQQLKYWVRWLEETAEKYANEFGTPGEHWSSIFSAADILEAASNAAGFYKMQYDAENS